jgi:hypothetical protein
MTAFKKIAITTYSSPIPILNEMQINLNSILNRGITFSENFDAVFVEFTSSATPDAENTVSHSLGKIPTGYIVYSIDKAGVVYRSATTFTSTNIYLKCNVASTAIKILVF